MTAAGFDGSCGGRFEGLPVDTMNGCVWSDKLKRSMAGSVVGTLRPGAGGSEMMMMSRGGERGREEARWRRGV